jgi:nucleotide-binding universal stress UspA family protein
VLKTVLVALDCSEMSETLINSLDILHLNAKNKIILSHVLPSPAIESGIDPDRPQLSRDDRYQEIEKHLMAYQNIVPNSVIEIVYGDPAEEIIRLANLHRVDLIIIGTRDLKGFKRIIEGSVSSQVVTDAPCSVFVVKPQYF